MRTCPNCKWEYPDSFDNRKCTFCKTEFSTQLCRSCKEWKPLSEYYRYNTGYLRLNCKSCCKEHKRQFDLNNKQTRYERDRRFIVNRRQVADHKFAQWQEQISKLPLKLLTEQQWLETCSFFSGCAICNSESIEVRQYFVGFKDGGKYTAWNIYPMCGKCSKKTKLVANPFIWMDRYIGYAKDIGLTDQVAERLVGYLQSQIERVRQ